MLINKIFCDTCGKEIKENDISPLDITYNYNGIDPRVGCNEEELKLKDIEEFQTSLLDTQILICNDCAENGNSISEIMTKIRQLRTRIFKENMEEIKSKE